MWRNQDFQRRSNDEQELVQTKFIVNQSSDDADENTLFQFEISDQLFTSDITYSVQLCYQEGSTGRPRSRSFDLQ